MGQTLGLGKNKSPMLLAFLSAFFVAPNGTDFNMFHWARLECEQKFGAKFRGINY